MVPLVELLGVSKNYGATSALCEVSIAFRGGEIHALLGENGAGKSTLVKFISGNVQADRGEIVIDGQAVSFATPIEAARSGVAVVHQELSIIENLTTTENICLGALPLRDDWFGRKLGVVDRNKCREIARAALSQMNSDLPLDVPAKHLRQAERQITEIARALATNLKVLVLDEPTSSLPPSDRETLYKLMRRVANQGIAVIIITHSLEEALDISDRVTVLRDGTKVWSGPSAEMGVAKLIEHMTGEVGGDIFPRRESVAEKEPLLVAKDVVISPTVRRASFEVLPGEVVGLIGLVGSGSSDILSALFGRLPIDAGEVYFLDKALKPRSPRDAIANGIAYVPGDRQDESLFHPLSVGQNAIIARQFHPHDTGGLVSHGVLSLRNGGKLASRLQGEFAIKAPSLGASIGALSGGNQQKVILARWFATQPRLLLADEPTKGVSVGSKMEIYSIIKEMKGRGTSILMTTSDYEEAIGICDRVYVLANGATVEEIRTENLSSHQLLRIVLDSSSSHQQGDRGGNAS